jgi:hypothetical protein
MSDRRRRRLIAIPVLIVMSVAWVDGTAGRDDEVSNPTKAQIDAESQSEIERRIEAFAAEQRAYVESQKAGMPVGEMRSIRELVRFRLEGGRLTVDVVGDAAPMVNGERVDRFVQPLSDVAGVCTVQIVPLGDAGSMSRVAIHHFNESEHRLTIAELSQIGSILNLSLSEQGLSGSSTSQYIDNPMAAGNEPGRAIAFYVQRLGEGAIPGVSVGAFGDEDGQQAAEENAEKMRRYVSSSFAGLMSDHVDARLPLRRMFTAMGAPEIPALASAPLALDLAADGVWIDAERLEEIDALIKRLDADEYVDRQAASDALDAMGIDARIRLLQIDPMELSPEQHSRAEALLSETPRGDAEEIAALRVRGEVVIDLLYHPDVRVRRAGVELLKRAGVNGDEIPSVEVPDAGAIERLRERILRAGQSDRD